MDPLFGPELFQVIGGMSGLVVNLGQEVTNLGGQVRSGEALGGEGEGNDGLKHGSQSWFVQVNTGHAGLVEIAGLG